MITTVNLQVQFLPSRHPLSTTGERKLQEAEIRLSPVSYFYFGSSIFVLEP